MSIKTPVITYLQAFIITICDSDGIINLNLGNTDDEFYDLQLTPDDKAILAGFTVSQGDLFYHLLLMKFDAF